MKSNSLICSQIKGIQLFAKIANRLLNLPQITQIAIHNMYQLIE